MSRKRKKRKQKDKRKRNSKYSNYNLSSLDQHRSIGKRVSPPMTQLPQMATSSWSDDHMPEMLWAVLLTGVFDRSVYLACFREILAVARPWFLKEEDSDNAEKSEDEEVGPNLTIILDHTKLSEISDEQFQSVIEIPLRHPLGYAALRPLLLLESLPGVDRWKQVLKAQPTDKDWETLATSIAKVFDHQSEASTDIRWFKLVLPIISGRMLFPKSMAESLEELRLFPNKGDMRKVRPLIRSSEMMFRRNPSEAWIGEFWNELHSKTLCIDPTTEKDISIQRTKIDPKSLFSSRDGVIDLFFEKKSSERADARLDSTFGLVLYALSLIYELGYHNIQSGIAGRLVLRALVEANITLKYLAKKDDQKTWKSYRVFGAGQAKLAFLKAQEVAGDLPPFIEEDILYEIANEDIWQEFLDINIGHWANSNLRKLAIETGAKELYDKYYDWASTYAHSHWGAIRDTNFITCQNPLHRLHRIPRQIHRTLSSVEQDSVALINEMIDIMGNLYPSELKTELLKLVEESESETSPVINVT